MTDPRRELLLPLLALHPRQAPDDDTLRGGLAAWGQRVSEAQETAMLLNERGRVVAISTGCALALNIDASNAIGQPLLDLLLLVDFTAAGVPVDDPDVHLPPLKALRTGTLARGLVRLRVGKGVLTTYDCVGVPLAGGDGALGFFAEV